MRYVRYLCIAVFAIGTDRGRLGQTVYVPLKLLPTEVSAGSHEP